MVGISLTSQSQSVIQHAFTLAQHHRAKLTVAYIVDFGHGEVRQLKIPEGIDKKEIFEKFRQTKKEEVATFVQEIAAQEAFQQVDYSIKVKFGYTHEALCGLVEEFSVELLVIGKFTEAGNLFFSKASDKFINWSPCPLYIVPEDVAFQIPKRIVYASSLVLEDCENIFYLLPWCEVFGTTLICLHVSQSKEEDEKSRRKLQVLDRLFPQENITFRSVVAPLEKGIERYVQLSKSDMVATMHRNRKQWLWNNFFKAPSVSKTIAKELQLPMIVFQQE